MFFPPVPLCLGDCFVEKSAREAEEKKLPPALRVARAPNPASLRRAAGDVRTPLWTEKYTQTHPNSSLLNSQSCEGCPTICLDWEMSVYMNTHYIPSDILPPPHHFTASHVSCPTTITLPPRTDTYSIQTHECTTQVGWMLNVEASQMQSKATQVRSSEAVCLISVSQTENTHIHKWSHTVWMHNKTGATTEEKKTAADDHHNIYPFPLQQELLFFASLDSAHRGLSLASSLPQPLQNDAIWSLASDWKYSRHVGIGPNEGRERLSYGSTHTRALSVQNTWVRAIMMSLCSCSSISKLLFICKVCLISKLRV